MTETEMDGSGQTMGHLPWYDDAITGHSKNISVGYNQQTVRGNGNMREVRFNITDVGLFLRGPGALLKVGKHTTQGGTITLNITPGSPARVDWIRQV